MFPRGKETVMKSIKRFLIPLLLAVSILLSACAGAQTGKDTDTTAADTTAVDTTDAADTTADTGGNTPDDTPPEETDERYSYEAWRQNAYNYLNSVKVSPDDISNFTDDSSSLAWGRSYLLDALYRGYCATGDVEFLEQMSIYLYGIYEVLADKDGDGYLNWGTAHYSDDGTYEEFAVHTGMVGLTAGEFACLIYADPALAEQESPLGMTYLEVADYLIDRTVNHLIPAFERDWNDEIGVYMDRPGSSNYNGSIKKISLPHNQYLALAMTLINFAKVSPEHSEEYVYRAERMLEVFSSNVIRYPNVGLVDWHYADALFEGDEYSSSEDFSHGMIDVRAAIFGYENGLAFSLHDVESFANNYATVMHRDLEEYPALSYVVNGRGTSEGLLYFWIFDMALYRNVLADRGMTYMLNTGAQNGGDSTQILVYHPDTPKPESFSLTSPALDEEVDPSLAVFRWQRTACANYYCLQIAEDAEFNNIIVNRDKIPDSTVIVKDLPEGSQLYYRVIAKNMKGEETVSDIFSFTVKGGNK